MDTMPTIMQDIPTTNLVITIKGTEAEAPSPNDVPVPDYAEPKSKNRLRIDGGSLERSLAACSPEVIHELSERSRDYYNINAVLSARAVSIKIRELIADALTSPKPLSTDQLRPSLGSAVVETNFDLRYQLEAVLSGCLIPPALADTYHRAKTPLDNRYLSTGDYRRYESKRNEYYLALKDLTDTYSRGVTDHLKSLGPIDLTPRGPLSKPPVIFGRTVRRSIHGDSIRDFIKGYGNQPHIVSAEGLTELAEPEAYIFYHSYQESGSSGTLYYAGKRFFEAITDVPAGFELSLEPLGRSQLQITLLPTFALRLLREQNPTHMRTFKKGEGPVVSTPFGYDESSLTYLPEKRPESRF